MVKFLKSEFVPEKQVLQLQIGRRAVNTGADTPRSQGIRSFARLGKSKFTHLQIRSDRDFIRAWCAADVHKWLTCSSAPGELEQSQAKWWTRWKCPLQESGVKLGNFGFLYQNSDQSFQDMS